MLVVVVVVAIILLYDLVTIHEVVLGKIVHFVISFFFPLHFLSRRWSH